MIIYKECEYTILPSYINIHFTSKPHNLEPPEYRSIANKVVEVDRLIGNKEALH